MIENELKRLVSLPWYDLPEIVESTNALWTALACAIEKEGLGKVPRELCRSVPCRDQWHSPNLLFSQSCGYDLILSCRESLQIIATPVYSAKGCSRGTYRSFLLVRDSSPYDSIESLRGSRCVINETNSHSGRNSLNSVIAPLSREGVFFSDVIHSGGHADSIEAISGNRADVGAIDCITYALLHRHRPSILKGTRVLSDTEEAVAPPFVTSRSTSLEDVEILQGALSAVSEDPSLQSHRENLLFEGIELFPWEAYEQIAEVEQSARSLRYYELLPSKSE